MVKAITHILKNDGNLGPLIGANASGDTKKIYPMISTQGEVWPLITVWQVSRLPELCKGSRSSTFNYTYDVHLYAKTYDSLDALQDAVIDALEDEDITSAINGVTFGSKIRNTNSRDGGYLGDYQVYNRVLTFEATTNESPAT